MSTVPSDPGVRSLKRAQVHSSMLCGIAGFVTLFFGPGNPPSEAGNEALALVEAAAAEDAA